LAISCIFIKGVHGSKGIHKHGARVTAAFDYHFTKIHDRHNTISLKQRK